MAHILLVDDDPDILRFARTLLAQQNHDVTTAKNAYEAMDCLKNFTFDALVTDLNMPHVSGYELVKAIRGDSRHRDIAVAMLSSRRERKDIELALQAGVDDYIVKPIDPDLFIRKIQDLCTKKSVPIRSEWHLPRAHGHTKAILQMPMTVVAVSEFGLVVRSSHEFSPGEFVNLETPIFREAGVIEAPFLKVLTSIPHREGGYETRVAYVGANETTLQRIRGWINKNIIRSSNGLGEA